MTTRSVWAEHLLDALVYGRVGKRQQLAGNHNAAERCLDQAGHAGVRYIAARKAWMQQCGINELNYDTARAGDIPACLALHLARMTYQKKSP